MNNKVGIRTLLAGPYSLRSVLIVTAFSAMIASQIQLMWRNRALVSEVEMLRREVGHLQPQDTSKVNLIRVPSGDPLIVRWRIFAPAGTFFDAGIRAGVIPKSGVGESQFSECSIAASENGVLVTASVTQGLDGESILSLDLGSGNVLRNSTRADRAEWLTGSMMRTIAGSNGIEVAELDKPIVLLRNLISNSTGLNPPGPGESHGMIFWIVPRKTP